MGWVAVSISERFSVPALPRIGSQIITLSRDRWVVLCGTDHENIRGCTIPPGI